MYVCITHFEDKYYQEGQFNKQFRLIKILKPVPTMVASSVYIPRKSPRERVYQED